MSLQQVLQDLRAQTAKGNLAALIVHLNDTYFVEERKTSTGVTNAPGLSRIAKLIESLQELSSETIGADRTLVLHAGDFLSPSLLGKRTHGRHMVDVLKAIGTRYLILGNHEFDFEETRPGNLGQLLSDFSYEPVMCNLEHPEIRTVPWVVWPEDDDTPLVAITGVAGEQTCQVGQMYGWTAQPAVASAERTVAQILEQHPNVQTLIVLSHMSSEEDYELRRHLDVAWTRDFVLILGGHDHHIDWAERYGTRTLLAKNLSNARTMQLVTLPTREVIARHEGPARDMLHGMVRRIDTETLAEIPKSERVESLVEEYLRAVGGKGEDLLVQDFSSHTKTMDARDNRIRRQSTDFGNFVADCARIAFDADVALLNSGRFRIDDRLDPRITRHTLLETFLFDDPGKVSLCCLTLSRELTSKLLEHGLQRGGHGAFPQFSGAPHVRLQERDSIPRIECAKKRIRVVFVVFMIQDPQDGYRRHLEHALGAEVAEKEIVEAIASGQGLLETVASVGSRVSYDAAVRVQAATLSK